MDAALTAPGGNGGTGWQTVNQAGAYPRPFWPARWRDDEPRPPRRSPALQRQAGQKPSVLPHTWQDATRALHLPAGPARRRIRPRPLYAFGDHVERTGDTACVPPRRVYPAVPSVRDGRGFEAARRGRTPAAPALPVATLPGDKRGHDGSPSRATTSGAYAGIEQGRADGAGAVGPRARDALTLEQRAWPTTAAPSRPRSRRRVDKTFGGFIPPRASRGGGQDWGQLLGPPTPSTPFDPNDPPRHPAPSRHARSE